MKFLFSALTFAAVTSVGTLGQIISLNPAADAFLSAANPNANFGGAGSLAVSASGLPKGEFASLLRFDLAPAVTSFDALYGAGFWSIQSITLTLTATAPNNAIFNGNGAGPGGSNVNSAGQFSLQWLPNDAWIEGSGTPQAPGATGVTFSTLPTLVSGADETLGIFPFSGATTGSAAQSLALTPGFLADATTGSTVTLLATPADSSVAMVVNSRTGSVFSRPTLTVVAVPEPATAALALTGLLLCGRRPRRG